MDKIANAGEKSNDAEAVDVSACPVKRNNPLTTAVNGLRLVEPNGIEPSTSWMQTRMSSFSEFHNRLLCKHLRNGFVTRSCLVSYLWVTILITKRPLGKLPDVSFVRVVICSRT
jgi:hypothetical protein